MAYALNGTNNYIDFSIGALSGVDAGPMSVAVLIALGDANNGSLFHLVQSAGAPGGLFLETFNTLNYGQVSVAKVISNGNLSTVVGLIGSFGVLGGSKIDGGTGIARGHYGVLGSALTHFDTTQGGMADGPVTDATWKIRLGRWENSATEFAKGEIVVAAAWKRVLTDAEYNSLSTGTYATWQGTTPDWMVEFSSIGTRTDATGGGGNELGRFGTTIALVSDPVGFFPAAGGLTLSPGSMGNQSAFSGAVLLPGAATLAPGTSGQSEQSGGAILASGLLTLAPGSMGQSEQSGSAVLLGGLAALEPGTVGQSEQSGGALLVPGATVLTPGVALVGETIGNAILQPGAAIIAPGTIQTGGAYGGGALQPGVATLLPGTIEWGERFGGASISSPTAQTVSPGTMGWAERFGLASLTYLTEPSPRTPTFTIRLDRMLFESDISLDLNIKVRLDRQQFEADLTRPIYNVRLDRKAVDAALED